jgi:regulatory protein
MDPEAHAEVVAEAKRVARELVAAFAAEGAVGDVAVAKGRARTLVRAGRSSRAVAATLRAKGFDGEAAWAALANNDEVELAAAAVLTRKRRIGPFRPDEALDAAGRRHERAVLGRAGFPNAIASRILGMEREASEALIATLRRP